MLEKLDDVVVFSNDDVDLNDIYSDIVTLFSDGTGINTISQGTYYTRDGRIIYIYINKYIYIYNI